MRHERRSPLPPLSCLALLETATDCVSHNAAPAPHPRERESGARNPTPPAPGRSDPPTHAWKCIQRLPRIRHQRKIQSSNRGVRQFCLHSHTISLFSCTLDARILALLSLRCFHSCLVNSTRHTLDPCCTGAKPPPISRPAPPPIACPPPPPPPLPHPGTSHSQGLQPSIFTEATSRSIL